MKILYVSQYFPPEMGAPSARVHELSREWLAQGHEVTVLTAFPHHPTGIKAAEDRGVLTRRERHDGIDVLRTYVYAAPNKGSILRMASYASFMLSAAIIGRLRLSRPHVVIGTSPQLLCAAGAYMLARTMGAPFVFEVRDLWPESILAVEAMRDNLVISSLKALARFLYWHCDHIVTVGEGYADAIQSLYRIPKARMSVIPNGIDTGLFRPGPKDNAIREQYGWKNRFVVLYLGTHGMAHALDKVLMVAQHLGGNPRILFVFVGEGAEKETLKSLASKWNLKNVQFIEQQPKSRVPLFYSACDLGLVTVRNTPLFREVIPSKLFEYMGMERPVLMTVGGHAKRMIEEAGAGEFVNPEDVPAMVNSIHRLSESEERLASMGTSGRNYVIKRFDRRFLAADYLRLLRTFDGRS